MQVDILHSTRGDKKRKIDTDSERGRQEAAILLNRLMKEGAAVFLERENGKKRTYRVKAYDPAKDLLTVVADVKGQAKTVSTRGSKAKATAVAPTAGG